MPVQGSFAEVQPAPRSVPPRNTPAPDAKPIIPERSVARNDVYKRATPSNTSNTDSAALTDIASPPRRRDATPPTTGRTSLPSLQEVDYHKPQQVETTQRNSPTLSNGSRTQSPHVAVAERQVPRRSTEESLRSSSAAGGSFKEKSGLMRALDVSGFLLYP